MESFPIAAGFVLGILTASLSFGLLYHRHNLRREALWSSRLSDLEEQLQEIRAAEAKGREALANLRNHHADAERRGEAFATGIQEFRHALADARICARLCREEADRAQAEAQDMRSRLAAALIAQRRAERALGPAAATRQTEMREEAPAKRVAQA